MPEPVLSDLIGLETDPRSVDYGWKDVVLYALGVGVPVDDLGYLYEGAAGGLQVLPSYCVIPEYEAMRDLEGRFDQSRMLHGEQLIRMFRPIPPEGPLVVTGKVVNIFDKGKAAVIHSSATGLTEVVIGGDRPDLVDAVREVYRPNTVLAWGEPYNSPLWESRTEGLAYVCRDYTCEAPASTAEDLLARL